MTSATTKVIGVIVGGAGFYGGTQGLRNWLLEPSSGIRLLPALSLVQDLTNAGIASTRLVYNVSLYAGFAMLMAATAPISIPLVLIFAERDKVSSP